MDKHCYNHPMETARWYCENCHTLLCDRCIDADHAEDDHRLCGKCHQPSEYVPNKTDVVPFYHRVGDFFKYPFQESGLILLLLTFLVTLFTSGVPFIGWIAALALLAVQTKYGFTAIKQLTEGDFKAPSLGDAIADSSFVIALKPVILYILMAIIVAALWIKVATFLGIVAIIFFSLALPLSITILALEDSFSEALNPVRLATAMKRIGMPYLLVWFYLLMMISGSMTVTTILFENTTYTIANAGASVSGCYFTFVMYALMGYMIHQYRFELGAGPADSDLEVKQQSALKHPRVEALLVAGEYSKVMNLLEKEWANTAQNVNLALLYARLCLQLNDYKGLEKRIGDLISHFALERRGREFAELLRGIIRVDKSFEMRDTSQAIAASDLLRDADEIELAIRILRNHYTNQDMKVRDMVVSRVDTMLRQDLGKPELADNYQRQTASFVSAQSTSKTEHVELSVQGSNARVMPSSAAQAAIDPFAEPGQDTSLDFSTSEEIIEEELAEQRKEEPKMMTSTWGELSLVSKDDEQE